MDGLKQRIDEYLVKCENTSIQKLFIAEEFLLLKAKERLSASVKK